MTLPCQAVDSIAATHSGHMGTRCLPAVELSKANSRLNTSLSETIRNGQAAVTSPPSPSKAACSHTNSLPRDGGMVRVWMNLYSMSA